MLKFIKKIEDQVRAEKREAIKPYYEHLLNNIGKELTELPELKQKRYAEESKQILELDVFNHFIDRVMTISADKLLNEVNTQEQLNQIKDSIEMIKNIKQFFKNQASYLEDIEQA